MFGVRAEDLVEWNNLDPGAKLHPGMVLQVFVRKDFDPSGVMLLDPSRVRVVTLGSEEFLELETARRGKKRLMYTCKAGDTLTKLGRRYGLTPGDLARINRFSYNTELHDGDRIVVYSPTGEAAHEVTRGLTPSRTAARAEDRLRQRWPQGARRQAARRQTEGRAGRDGETQRRAKPAAKPVAKSTTGARPRRRRTPRPPRRSSLRAMARFAIEPGAAGRRVDQAVADGVAWSVGGGGAPLDRRRWRANRRPPGPQGRPRGRRADHRHRRRAAGRPDDRRPARDARTGRAAGRAGRRRRLGRDREAGGDPVPPACAPARRGQPRTRWSRASLNARMQPPTRARGGSCIGWIRGPAAC